jgi:hypothetical protein
MSNYKPRSKKVVLWPKKVEEIAITDILPANCGKWREWGFNADRGCPLPPNHPGDCKWYEDKKEDEK